MVAKVEYVNHRKDIKMTDPQIFCPMCIAAMLLAETTEEGLVYICPKCRFQLNLDLKEECI